MDKKERKEHNRLSDNIETQNILFRDIMTLIKDRFTTIESIDH